MWCELVMDFSRLEELSPAWQRWANENDHGSIFQRWEWARAYWKAYGGTVSLHALTIHDNDRTVGILPLVRTEKAISFLGSPESDYNDLLCEKGYAAPVLETALDFLLESQLPWKSAVLDNLPAHSQIIRNFQLLPRHIHRHSQLIFRCPCPAISVHQNRSEVLDALINKEQLKRYHRKLQKSGSLVFRHINTREEILEHLERFFHQHICRCAMNGQRSQFLETERRIFYQALIEELNPAEELRFGVLELARHPIAYHLGFELNGTLTWYKPTFDVNYWEYCPGDVLLRSLLQYMKDTALNELDFTIGDEPFKNRFSNHVRQNYALYIEPKPAHIGSCLRTVVRSVEHVIRQKPELKSALKNNIQRLRDFAFKIVHFGAVGGFLKHCYKALRAVSRCLASRDEVLFYRSPEKNGLGASAVQIVRGTLDDIASLSVEFGYFLSAAQLREYRQKLQQGRQLFIARDQAGEAFVLWVEGRSNIYIREVGKDCILPLTALSLVLDDCWRAPNPTVRQVSSEVLRALATYLGGAQFWLYSVQGRDSLSHAAQSAELELTHRLTRYTLLYGFRHIRVRSESIGNHPLKLSIEMKAV